MRSADSVKNLYTMQKNYLALHEASSLGLFTIVISIYTMPGLLSGMKKERKMEKSRKKKRGNTTTASFPMGFADSVKNLYAMQKNYLVLHEASSLGLFTIVKSIYTMPGLQVWKKKKKK